MLKEALDWIRTRGDLEREILPQDQGGHTVFVGAGGVHLPPATYERPYPKTIGVSTLVGLAELVQPDHAFICASWNSAALWSKPDDDWHRQRHAIAKASYSAGVERWNRPLDVVTAVRWLETAFTAEGDQPALVEVLRDTSSRKTIVQKMLGNAWKMSGEMGVTSGDGDAEAFNRFEDHGLTLHPRRVFPDAYHVKADPVSGVKAMAPDHQPAVRVYWDVEPTDEGPRITFLEADGEAWKIEAARDVAAKLRELLTSAVTVVS